MATQTTYANARAIKNCKGATPGNIATADRSWGEEVKTRAAISEIAMRFFILNSEKTYATGLKRTAKSLFELSI